MTDFDVGCRGKFTQPNFTPLPRLAGMCGRGALLYGTFSFQERPDDGYSETEGSGERLLCDSDGRALPRAVGARGAHHGPHHHSAERRGE